MNVSMFRTRAVALKSVLCCAMMLLAAPTHAAIPSSERSVLLSLYSSAGGGGWSDNSGWNGASGTECSWNGIVCDAGQTHVVAIALGSNNLVGTLPASLSALTALQSLATKHRTAPLLVPRS